MWDIAVGGHITSGEDDINSAKRELEEELGIHPEDFKMTKVDRITERFVNNGVISNEYVSIFIIYADIDIRSIKLQTEEVIEVKWCTKEELNKFIKEKTILAHVREYEILNEILKD